MKLHLNIFKTALASALLFFAATAHAQKTQQIFGVETGTSVTSPAADALVTENLDLDLKVSPEKDFSFDIAYNDDHTTRSVVSFNIHYDGSKLTYKSANLAAVNDADTSNTCQSGSNVASGVTSAGANLKISGVTAPATDTSATAVGGADADFVTVTFAQICGDVFGNDVVSVMTNVTFTALAAFETTNGDGATTIKFTAANGGDHSVAQFQAGNEIAITEQTFTLDVDGSTAINAGDITLIARYLLLGGDNLPNSLLEQDVATASGKATDIKSSVGGGITSLDVDASGATNSDDVTLIARYVLLGGENLPNSLLEQDIPTAAGKGAEIKAAIAGLQ